MMLDVTGTGTVHLVVHVHDTYILYIHALPTWEIRDQHSSSYANWGFFRLGFFRLVLQFSSKQFFMRIYHILLLMNRKYVFFRNKS